MKTTQWICSCLLLCFLGCGNGDGEQGDESSDVLVPPSYVEVQTESGTVRGEAIKGLHVFKGIPLTHLKNSRNEICSFNIHFRLKIFMIHIRRR